MPYPFSSLDIELFIIVINKVFKEACVWGIFLYTRLITVL